MKYMCGQRKQASLATSREVSVGGGRRRKGRRGGGGVGADLMQKRTTVIAGKEALTVTTA